MDAVESRTISCLCWESNPNSSVVQPPSLAAVPTYEYLLGENINTKKKARAIAWASCQFPPRPAARVVAVTATVIIIIIIIIMSLGDHLIT
jgi:hypothetical protein